MSRPEPGSLDPTRWLDEHGDALWRYAIGRIRRADTAEELVQATLLAALEAKDRFRGEADERTWLVSILRRKIADHVRQERRREGATWAGPEFRPSGTWAVGPRRWPTDAEAMLAKPEFWVDLEACLGKLPAGVAEAFVLREVRQAEAEAVCGALKISAANLWVRVHRARLLLRRCLAGKWAPDRGEKGP
jgi:RNA polymerase sigma-70 factor (ECF subfamily)